MNDQNLNKVPKSIVKSNRKDKKLITPKISGKVLDYGGNNDKNLYGIINDKKISKPYAERIRKSTILSKEEETSIALEIASLKKSFNSILFSVPEIASHFIIRFDEIKYRVISAKNILELSRYLTQESIKENKQLHDDSDDEIDKDDKEKSENDKDIDIEPNKKEDKKVFNKKKNIFYNIGDIIKNKVKPYIDEIKSYLSKIKLESDISKRNAIIEKLGNPFKNIFLHKNIVNEMYDKFINTEHEINNQGNNKLIMGLPSSMYKSKIKELKRLHKKILELTNKLVIANLRLVVSICKKQQRMYNDDSFGDMIQAGNEGLRKAIDKYQPKAGALTTYGTWWVEQGKNRKGIPEKEPVKLPIHMKELIGKISKALNKLPNNLSQQERIEAVSNETNMTKDKVEKIMKIHRNYFNLEYKNNKNEIDSDESSYITSNDNMSPMEYIIEKDNERRMANLAQNLNPREREIFYLRFMNYHDKYSPSMTLEMIGYKLGITKERVRQILIGIVIKSMFELLLVMLIYFIIMFIIKNILFFSLIMFNSFILVGKYISQHSNILVNN